MFQPEVATNISEEVIKSSPSRVEYFENANDAEEAESASHESSGEKQQEAPLVSPNLPWYLYEGDVVVQKTVPKGWDYVPKFGTVLKQPLPNIETESDDTFNVRWENHNVVEKLKSGSVSLVDRLLLKNTKVETEQGKIGYVSDWNVTSTVQIIGTTHVVHKVPLERLRPITYLVRGQEIMYQNWVGVVTSVKRNIWFHLDGGMAFHIDIVENDGFGRNDPYWGLGMPCPGIRTKLTSAVMRNARWTSGPMRFFSKILPPLSYLYSLAHVTLQKSEVTQITVNWLSVAPNCKGDHYPRPVPVIYKNMLKDIVVIGVPSSETLGINSVRVLKLLPEDYLTSYNSWIVTFQRKFLKNEEAEPQKLPIAFSASLRTLAAEKVYEVPVKVLNRQTVLDVTFQDGSIEKISSIKIPRIVEKRENAEFPNGMIVAPLYTQNDLIDYYGVVVDGSDLAKRRSRVVNVMWMQKGSPVGTSPTAIFNLQPHPHYCMFERGTIVFPRDPSGTLPFAAASVTDVSIPKGKLTLTVTSDQSRHEVYPHEIVPMQQRCFWNFFTKQWAIDDIIPPAYHVQSEYSPSLRHIEVAAPSTNVLTNNNASTMKIGEEVVGESSVWDEPSFEMLAFAPESHRFYNSSPNSFGKDFNSRMMRELEVLKEEGTLPDGVWIRAYENRLDLLSALLVGPSNTPYEDGIFMFDLQMSNEFPNKRPLVHYHSYSFELNPYVGWDGNFCTSALNWRASDELNGSKLASFFKEIPELIFTQKPLLSGPTLFVREDSPRKNEYARGYNEFVLMRVLDSSWNMLHRPHQPWAELIKAHFASTLPEKLGLYESWCQGEEESLQPQHLPGFPIFPVSEGFLQALSTRVEKFKKICPIIKSPEKKPGSKTQILDSTADSESVPVTMEGKNSDLIQLDEEVNKASLEPPEAVSGSPSSQPPSKSDSPLLLLDTEKNVISYKKKGKRGSQKSRLEKGKSSASSAVESEVSEGVEEEEEGKVDMFKIDPSAQV